MTGKSLPVGEATPSRQVKNWWPASAATGFDIHPPWPVGYLDYKIIGPTDNELVPDHYGISRRDRQTLRPTDETAHTRTIRTTVTDDTGHLHRGAYPSTAAVSPRCLARLVAVTDTYDGYEHCSLIDFMDMYYVDLILCMSDNS